MSLAPDCASMVTDRPVDTVGDRFRLLAVFAHPDDESCGPGATLARYSRLGAEESLVCVTKGEQGSWGDDPGMTPSRLGLVRVQELARACKALGIRRWAVLGCRDGRIAQCDRASLERELVRWIRLTRPQVLLTCFPEEANPKADHSLVAETTRRAYFSAGDRRRFLNLEAEGLAPWEPSKLYYAVPWDPDRLYTLETGAPLTWLDVTRYTGAKARALRCHASQAPCWKVIEGALRSRKRWIESFYLVHSRAPCAGSPESDLFCGLTPDYARRMSA